MGKRSFVTATSAATGEVRKFATHRCAMAAAAVFGCVASGAPVQAADDADPNTFEITPFVGLMAGGSFEDPTDGSDRDVDGDTNLGIVLNLIADMPERQYELLYSKESSTVDGATTIDLDLEYLQIGGHVAYPQSEHVVPYFGVTVGAARFSPDEVGYDDETKFALTAGGGVKIPITQHFGLRLDVRAFVTFLEDDSQIFCVSAGSTTCLIRPKSDTFVQYAGSLGFSFGF